MVDTDVLSALLAALSSFGVAAVATPAVRYFARRWGFVAHPRPDRWHQHSTALLGGVAIYLGIIAAMVLFGGQDPRVWLLVAGITGIFVLGLVDDLLKLPPYQKLVGQIAIASLVGAGGLVFEGLPVRVLALPLTVFWLVAITNAFNLLDNMDGLSAGIALVSGVVLAAIGLLDQHMAVAVAGASVAGASLGFLLYNFSPASIFMGDAGSMTLGFLVGGLAVLGNQYGTSQNVLLTLVVPVAVLGVPLFDTTLVSIVRTLYGRPISQGGRDHTSHRLVALGLSVRQTVWVLYLISAAFGAFAISTRYMDVLMSIAVLALLLVALVLFGIYLAQVKVYRDNVPREPSVGRPVTVISGTLMHKVRLAEVLLDLVLIFVAYLAAYLLKFEGTLSGPFLDQFAKSLPFVTVIKLSTFLLASVYGEDWEHIGFREMFDFSKASTFASLLCAAAIAIVWHFEGFSRSVIVIDWLLFTSFVTASRMSFRLLGHWAQSLSGAKYRRLLIVGSRERGGNVVRAVQQGLFGEYTPVGFVDVAEEKRGQRVAGVDVLGTVSRLGTILNGLRVDGVVVAVDGDPDIVKQIVAECVSRGVPSHEIPRLETALSQSDARSHSHRII